MYEKFYDFKEKPFNTTPDTRFFFASDKHFEALNSLYYVISERKGFAVITGEIGSGKTTVCRALLNKLDLKTKVANITNTHLTAKELIAEILEDLEVEYRPGTKQKLLSQLNAYLIQQLSQDINVVLMIDEAQNLSSKVLEEVRMLSNLETEREKLIQIILIGQPQLKAKLEQPKLEQFKQRIVVHYHLFPLSKSETEAYIFFRLRQVSSNGFYLFTPKAIDLIYEHSKGIPRLINLICDSALLSGFIYNFKKINEKIITEVVKERDFNRPLDELITTNYELSNKYHELKQASDNYAKIHCCTSCQHYNTCETKFTRGTKGEEQLCCPECKDYKYCIENAKQVKLN